MRSIVTRASVFSLAIFLLISIPSYSATERRTALVIGNSNYDFGSLRNTINDAADIAASLKNLGFNVTLKNNTSLREIEEAIESFGQSLKKGGVGLFYYAGHGIQVSGTNYLIPVGAKVRSERDIKYEALDVNKILDEMDNAGNGVNIVILDACRDNPFARSFRSASRGLAIISKPPQGTLISYSTGANQVARDGDGRNSPYASALLEYMKAAGLPVEQVFKKVRNRLYEETGGQQEPAEYTTLRTDFYFIPENAAGKEAAAPQILRVSEKGFTDPIAGMEFVFVKGGCYQMGDTFGDGGSNEKPVHEVCVDDSFIGKYKVTVGQFRAFVGATGYRTEAERGDGCLIFDGSKWNKKRNASWRDPGFSPDDNHPVACVSWNDAQEFSQWLTRTSGQVYRLLTEAEWEFAARSGGKREKFSGGDDVNRVAWYKDNAGQKTHPVGTKEANGLGIYDMSGNLWEWCQDRYDKSYYGTSPRNNPTGPSTGSLRVSRGGAWNRDANYCRSASRGNSPPDHRSDGLGFRITRDVAEAPRPKISQTREMRRDGRFIAYDNGTVPDAETNLMWAAKDNWSDVNWAKSYLFGAVVRNITEGLVWR